MVLKKGSQKGKAKQQPSKPNTRSASQQKKKTTEEADAEATTTKAAPAKKNKTPKKSLVPVLSESEDESDYSDLDEDQKKELLASEDIIPLSEEKLEESLKPVTDKALKKLGRKGKGGGANEPRGVIYLGHLPYGFFEDQMKSFFSQFGEVTRLRLSRNKKTGRSRHYAFIEFKSPEVAEIVADTMHQYMMFGRTLVCQYLEPGKVHPDMFKGANKKFRVVPRQQISKDVHNRVRNEKEQTKRVSKLLAKDKKRRQKLADLGIEYDYQGYSTPSKRRRKTFD